jgi:hypothetical protein
MQLIIKFHLLFQDVLCLIHMKIQSFHFFLYGIYFLKYSGHLVFKSILLSECILLFPHGII